jgi:molybdopterin-guanine dinucleotide biosynthesis protein A
MGGEDKGLLRVAGKPLVGWLLEYAAHHSDALSISANRNLEHYATFGYPVISDSGNSLGPLSGIATALQLIQRPLLLVLPCDTPFLPPDLVDRLLAALQEEGADVAVPECDGQVHHAVMLCHTSVQTSLLAFLEQDKRRVGEWLAAQKTARVAYSDPSCFSNLNTPEDLARAEQRLAERPNADGRARR